MNKASAKKRKLPQWMTKSGPQMENCLEKDAKKVAGEGDNGATAGDILKLPYLKFHGSVIYSYNADDCSLLCEDLCSSLPGTVCGFDIEWPVTYQPGVTPKTALLQLCFSKDKCYLFHLSHMQCFPKALKALICNHEIKKTGVGIESDLWKLEKDFDLPALDIIKNSMVDLSPWASRLLKSKQNWSLDGLTKNLLQQQLNKDPAIRKGDWSCYPLTEEQIQYAATDAYASLLLYEKLKNMS